MKKAMLAAVVLCVSGACFAKGGSGHSHSGHYSYSSGTGSKAEHTHVSGYTKKDGTYVVPHDRSTADHTKNNNWSTKGNTNPETDKQGTKKGDDE